MVRRSRRLDEFRAGRLILLLALVLPIALSAPSAVGHFDPAVEEQGAAAPDGGDGDDATISPVHAPTPPPGLASLDAPARASRVPFGAPSGSMPRAPPVS